MHRRPNRNVKVGVAPKSQAAGAGGPAPAPASRNPGRLGQRAATSGPCRPPWTVAAGRDCDYVRARCKSLLRRGAEEATMGARGRRSRALLDPSQEQTPGLVRFPALHALVRHLQPRLSADEGGARLHAAAGPAPDRGLHAGRVAGPLHRREYPQGDRRRIRVGRRRPGQRHARPGPADSRYRRARARGGQGRHAGRPVGVRLARNVSRHRLSPHRRDGRRNRSADRSASTRASRARPRKFASKPRSGFRCRISRSRPTTSSR